MNILIGIPTYDGQIHFTTALAAFLHRPPKTNVTYQVTMSSLLAFNFNTIWSHALNMKKEGKLDYFIMLHADIGPDPEWVTKLVKEMEETKADVISVVSPIKNHQGFTSTGLADPSNRWRVRRLTMREIYACDKSTFNAADLGHPDKVLCINTGLMIIDFRKPWVDKIHFRIDDKIVKNDDGVWDRLVVPEDWNFSFDLHEMGCKVLATKKVEISHFGNSHWTNTGPWGTEEKDTIVV